MLLLWDASGLAKRYYPERGSDTVDALFDRVPSRGMVTTLTVYAETYAALCRKRNRKEIGELSLRKALDRLFVEVLDDDGFQLWKTDDETILASLGLIESHHLNASDAAILSAFLRGADPGPGETQIIVTTDRRFARAAEAEGFVVLDPEALTPAEVAGLLERLQTR